jgi:hypothetical protein
VNSIGARVDPRIAAGQAAFVGTVSVLPSALLYGEGLPATPFEATGTAQAAAVKLRRRWGTPVARGSPASPAPNVPAPSPPWRSPRLDPQPHPEFGTIAISLLTTSPIEAKGRAAKKVVALRAASST